MVCKKTVALENSDFGVFAKIAREKSFLTSLYILYIYRVTSYFTHVGGERTSHSCEDTHEKETNTTQQSTNQLTTELKEPPTLSFAIFNTVSCEWHLFISTSSQWFRMSGGRNWDSKLITSYPFSIRYEMMRPSADNGSLLLLLLRSSTLFSSWKRNILFLRANSSNNLCHYQI